MDKSFSPSSKELRFVTSAEQMIPFLDRIRNSNQYDNDQDASDTVEIDPSDEVSDTTNQLTNVVVAPPPAITTVATSASIALPNIYEEYVNFIDLSVLNPIIDATTCQRDSLIENEISEL